jgi:hypothetical protein
MNVSYRGLAAVSNIIQRNAPLAYPYVKQHRRQNRRDEAGREDPDGDGFGSLPVVAVRQVADQQ